MKKVEVFSAGCSVCEETIAALNGLSGSKTVTVLKMGDSAVASRARSLGIKSVPAVLVDGRLADCCSDRGVNMDTIKVAMA